MHKGDYTSLYLNLIILTYCNCSSVSPHSPESHTVFSLPLISPCFSIVRLLLYLYLYRKSQSQNKQKQPKYLPRLNTLWYFVLFFPYCEKWGSIHQIPWVSLGQISKYLGNVKYYNCGAATSLWDLGLGFWSGARKSSRDLRTYKSWTATLWN